MPAPWRRRLGEMLDLDPQEQVRLAVFAPGVWRRRERLGQLLGADIRLQFARLSGAHAVAGWGMKGKGRERAEAAGLPYLALEDSFLSRLGADNGAYGLLGLIADPIGIYYQAGTPSLCEELIAASAQNPATPEMTSFLTELRRGKLGKFNVVDPERLRAPVPTRSFDAIVVDQIAGDLSIPGGLAEPEDFGRMLEAAFDENPGGEVAVKLHPYDGVGGRTGHLRSMAKRYGAAIIDDKANWMACAEHAHRVYVVSSNAGLEALIAGTKVDCFGVPFYGGWGLTDDRQQTPRRRARPSLGQLCSAVYADYATSYLPSEERIAAPLDLARFIAVQQRHARNLAGLEVAGLQKLKGGHIAAFSGPDASALEAKRSPYPPAPAVWASRVSKDDRLRAKWADKERLFVEDGFIRSAGLGADLVRPSSLVFDPLGIYYDPSGPSTLEEYLQTYNLEPDELDRAEALLELLRTSRVTKYNLDTPAPAFNSSGRPVLLVPGQVENDASILRGAQTVRTNLGLLQAVREARPDAFIAYKPHPDVEDAGRPGHVANLEEHADLVLKNVGASAAVECADEVHTITSLMGFEALLRGRKVVTYGLPFYAGWGLTEDQANCPRRGRKRSLEELAFLTLIAYPYYVSPRTGLPCTVETVIRQLAGQPTARPALPGAASALRLWRKARTLPAYLK